MTARSIRRALERKQKKLARKAERQSLLLETAAAAAPVPSVVRPSMQVCFASGSEEEPEVETAVSPARLAANQGNALLSTGPQTPSGKTKSSLNAVKTALTGRAVLLPCDDVAEYERHLAAYAGEFAPVGLLETNFVQSIADTDWRLRRIPALESALFAKGRIEFAELFDEQELAARPHLIDAHTFLAYEKQIRNLQLQEARLTRRREKEMAELRRLQADRTARCAAQQHLLATLAPVVRVQEARFEKEANQKTPKPAHNGFVFSTPQTGACPAAISAANPHTSVGGVVTEHRA
jgi:hypothetical protein